MGLFGKELYSREKYDKQARSVSASEKSWRTSRCEGGEGAHLHAVLQKEKLRLDKLKNRAESEAYKLQEEYVKLLEKAQRALGDVAEFEKKKLRMNEGESGESDEHPFKARHESVEESAFRLMDEVGGMSVEEMQSLLLKINSRLEDYGPEKDLGDFDNPDRRALVSKKVTLERELSGREEKESGGLGGGNDSQPEKFSSEWVAQEAERLKEDVKTMSKEEMESLLSRIKGRLDDITGGKEPDLDDVVGDGEVRILVLKQDILETELDTGNKK